MDVDQIPTLIVRTLPTSVLAVGWVQRWMQRRVLRSWNYSGVEHAGHAQCCWTNGYVMVRVTD